VTAGGDAGTTNPFGTGVFCCLRQTVAEYRLPSTLSRRPEPRRPICG